MVQIRVPLSVGKVSRREQIDRAVPIAMPLGIDEKKATVEGVQDEGGSQAVGFASLHSRSRPCPRALRFVETRVLGDQAAWRADCRRVRSLECRGEGGDPRRLVLHLRVEADEQAGQDDKHRHH